MSEDLLEDVSSEDLNSIVIFFELHSQFWKRSVFLKLVYQVSGLRIAFDNERAEKLKLQEEVEYYKKELNFYRKACRSLREAIHSDLKRLQKLEAVAEIARAVELNTRNNSVTYCNMCDDGSIVARGTCDEANQQLSSVLAALDQPATEKQKGEL